MGFSFRRSTSFGPFRLNLSKSGLGLSFGGNHARINMSSRSTYVTIGAGGLYYRQRLNADAHRIPRSPVDSGANPVSRSVTPRHQMLTTQDVGDVTDIDSKAFVEELESKARKRSWLKWLGVWPSLIILFGTFSLAEGYVHADMGEISSRQIDYTKQSPQEQRHWLNIAWIMLAFTLTAWCFFLRRLDIKRRTLELYYTLDDDIGSLHRKFLDCFQEFKSSYAIWQNLHAERVADQKYHAGASQIVSRVLVKATDNHKLPSSFLKTNVSIPCITLQHTELYFFPERIIVKRGNEFGVAFYRNIQVRSANVQFIEEAVLPPDASVINYTWKHLNKSGGPDRRFSDNRRLPVCLYTEYTFESKTGLHEVIFTSRTRGMDNFMAFLQQIAAYQQRLQTTI